MTNDKTIHVLTLAAAVVAALAALWNTRQLSRLVQSNQTAINSHVNAPGMHGR